MLVGHWISTSSSQIISLGFKNCGQKVPSLFGLPLKPNWRINLLSKLS